MKKLVYVAVSLLLLLTLTACDVGDININFDDAILENANIDINAPTSEESSDSENSANSNNNNDSNNNSNNSNNNNNNNNNNDNDDNESNNNSNGGNVSGILLDVIADVDLCDEENYKKIFVTSKVGA